jgi:N-acyl-D-aspartate/D-glutamate deacylase
LHDLVLRGGLVVDGTGDAPFAGDVAVSGGRVTEVGTVIGRGHTEIDADGHVVSPGFIDAHTHMDAQVFWDALGTSSCWHGVTSVVMGNCGFTLAPVPPDGFEAVVRNIERAEDIAAETLAAGVACTWEHFSEYLDVLDSLPKAINYAAYVGHSAVRTWAMGEQAFEREATEDDLRLMEREIQDALRAGAIGFSTSRGSHLTPDGRPVASRVGSWDEVCRLVQSVRSFPSAMVEIAPDLAVRSPDPEVEAQWYERLGNLARSSGVPLTFGVVPTHPTWQHQLEFLASTTASGGRLIGQAHSRGILLVLSFETQLPFDKLEAWKPIRSLSLAEQRKAFADPEVRARLVESAATGAYGAAFGAEARQPNYGAISVMDSPLPPNPTVAELAAKRGMHPAECMIELALENDFKQFFLQPVEPYSSDDILTVMRHPNTVVTFSDAGAHVSQIVDSSLQTHLIGYWVRERQALTLEEAVRMLTSDIAGTWGLTDRGVLRPGAIADINVFDAERVGPRLPTVEHDLPGGGRRLVQRAEGFLATIVGGEVVLRDGEHTGAFPGRLLRRSSGGVG